MKHPRELVGRDIGRVGARGDMVRQILRQQSCIAEFEAVEALRTLRPLSSDQDDRRLALEILERAEPRLDASPEQVSVRNSRILLRTRTCS
jgi:hypothetical protein